jgi:hypothetical protein
MPHHLADPLMAEPASHEIPEILRDWMLLARHPARLGIGPDPGLADLDPPSPQARWIGCPRLFGIGPLHDGRLSETRGSRTMPDRNTIRELNRLLFFFVVPKYGSAAT